MSAPSRVPVAGPDRTTRRAQLLDAADRVVQRDGPAASMAAMAAEAGITKPILYRHFGDRDGLCAALADRYTDRLLADLLDGLRAGTDRRDRVERTVGAYLAAIERDPQAYRFLLHSEESTGAQTRVRSFTRALAARLAEGMVAETGVDAWRSQVWAHGVVGMVQAAGDWWLATRDGDRDALCRELADLLFGAYARA